VKVPKRNLWLLLCLMLVVKAGVAAVLSVTGAAGYLQLLPDRCPLVALGGVAGSHDDHEQVAGEEQAAAQGSSENDLPSHHHHPCHGLCLMPAVAPAPIALPASCGVAGALPSPVDFSSAVLSPLVHPPRTRG